MTTLHRQRVNEIKAEQKPKYQIMTVYNIIIGHIYSIASGNNQYY